VPRDLVLITGPPGSGKSSLAQPLAERLDLPLLMKDTIKEAIHDGLGRRPLTEEESHLLGAATYEVIWATAALMPTLMIECNFRPDEERQVAHLLALHPRPIEVYCRCAPEIAATRFRLRHEAGERHPVHVVSELPVAMIEEFGRPLNLGPVIEVDTTESVDVDALTERLRDLLLRD
jgi:predicted kinase